MTGPSSTPAGDAVRGVVEAYAQLVDAREFAEVATLFHPTATFTMYLEPGVTRPTSVRTGHSEIVESLRLLEHFAATSHVIASHTSWHDGTGLVQARTRCIAHHLSADLGTNHVLWIWYHDVFAPAGVGWLIAERTLRVDAAAERPWQESPS